MLTCYKLREIERRPFGPAERDALGHFLCDEALRLESTPALIAQAEAFLRDRSILVPASSTLHRVVAERMRAAPTAPFSSTLMTTTSLICQQD